MPGYTSKADANLYEPTTEHSLIGWYPVAEGIPVNACPVGYLFHHITAAISFNSNPQKGAGKGNRCCKLMTALEDFSKEGIIPYPLFFLLMDDAMAVDVITIAVNDVFS